MMARGRSPFLVLLVAAAPFLVGAGAVPVTATAGAHEASVHSLPEGTGVPGASSWLARDDGGALMAMHTTGLEAGSAYTVWWVVFNRPEGCTTRPAKPVRCGPGDLESPLAEASALFAAGGVAAGRGDAFFGGRLPVRDTSGCQPELPCREGLTNPQGAEIHLVVRSHGPAVPEHVDVQMTTFDGGCHPGDANEGQCRNVQASAFPPA